MFVIGFVTHFIQTSGPHFETSITGGKPGYYEEGFLAVQHTIAMIVANELANNKSELDSIKVNLQRYPFPPYVKDFTMTAFLYLLPAIMAITYFVPFINITHNIVLEKERRLKEMMRMMGVKNWMHWLTWTVSLFAWLTIFSAILSCLMTLNVGDAIVLFRKSNISVVFVFLLTYSLSFISFCFLMSTLSSKVIVYSLKMIKIKQNLFSSFTLQASVAVISSGFAYFITFIPVLSISFSYR